MEEKRVFNEVKWNRDQVGVGHITWSSKLWRIIALSLTLSVLALCWSRTTQSQLHSTEGHGNVNVQTPTTTRSRPGCGGSRSHASMIPDKYQFDWGAIKPSPTFKWTSCYGKYQCARLEVPLDYSDEDGERAAVAVIMKPAKFASHQEGYRGPVLYNPGGPGASGIDRMLRGYGERFPAFLGEDYDIVGFDPRGVGFTTPSLDIFPDAFHAYAYAIRDQPMLDSSPTSFGHRYADGQAFAQLVHDRAKKVAEHISTLVTARDMLSTVRAFGREKLQYWGSSYGTLLGATFAAMFPDNIERMIIDGVIDAEDYYKTRWFNSLRDADKSELAIYDACVATGPDRCALYENSTSLVFERVNKIVDSLRRSPVAVMKPETGDIHIIDASLAERAIFITLMRSHAKGRALMDALAALEKGDGSPISDLLATWEGGLSDIRCDCSDDEGGTKFHFGRLDEATHPIACSDGDPVEDTVEELYRFYADMAAVSRWAKTWTLRLSCAGWKVRAKERFQGTFNVNTSFPLLLIGNTADPVTPLWSAHKMSEGFNNSVVLTQDSAGHCSSSAASSCTAKHIRQYFRDGKLPVPGTICDVQSSIFGDSPLAEAQISGMSEEDIELLRVSYEFARIEPVASPGFVH